MATRTCPDCGAQYVATVRRCIDCDVMLADEAVSADHGDITASDAASAGAPVGGGDQLGYELDGWGNQLKVTLEGMLDRAGIGRVWEAGALVVSAADEDVVDELIATLEGGEVAELGDDVARVALEIDGLDPDGQDDLDARLLASAIPHAWDNEGALIVAEADEARVLEIIEESLDHQADDDGVDGLAAQAALSAVYVSVDRLVKNPADAKLAATFGSAARSLVGLAVPYGFAAADWSELSDEIIGLADLVDPANTAAPDGAGDGDSDEVVLDQAAAGDLAASLRARLVDLV